MIWVTDFIKYLLALAYPFLLTQNKEYNPPLKDTT